MKWNDPQRLDRLAAEYVLGTLQGAARRRLEREIPANRMLRTRVVDWQEKFLPLTTSLEPVTPPARVWKSLERNLTPAKPDSRQGLWRHLGFWRGLGLLASSAALFLLVYLGAQERIFKPGPAYVAVVSDAKAQPAWLLRMSSRLDTLEVKTLAGLSIPPEKSFELWMLPSDGGAPISLGLLPSQGSKTLPLKISQSAVLKTARGLAVSLEPAGGSPTGAPTGPVQYQGTLFSLI